MSAAVTTELKTIGHWIGGESVQGSSGRKGPVYNPATGEQIGRGRLREPRGDRSRRRHGEGRVHRVAHVVALEALRALLPDLRPLRRASRGSREAAHRRARQGALGRARRGAARDRGDRVRLRHPHAAQGLVLGAGVDRGRRVLDSPASRCRRRDHPVQLPGDGAHVDVGAGDRVREHLRPEAVREGPFRIDPHRRAAEGSRPPRRRLQRRPRRQGRGGQPARAPRHRVDQLRRLDPDRPLRRTRTGRRRASACRRSAAPRTT